jgi:multiple sugar transport system permease protein
MLPNATSPAGSSSPPRSSAIAVFFALPVLAALAMSLTDFDIYALADLRNLRFVGLHNYAQLLQTPLFWQALLNTLFFVVVGVPLSIGASLGAAMLLHSPVARFQAFYRTALFAPVVTTLVAVAVVWRYLFHTRYGFLNYALASLGIDPSTGWATRPGPCRPSCCFACGRTLATTWSSCWPACRPSLKTCTKPRGWTAPSAGRCSATSPCPAWRRCCWWSAS